MDPIDLNSIEWREMKVELAEIDTYFCCLKKSNLDVYRRVFNIFENKLEEMLAHIRKTKVTNEWTGFQVGIPDVSDRDGQRRLDTKIIFYGILTRIVDREIAVMGLDPYPQPNG